MPCSSQQNREFTRAPTRIFVWRQSLRVGVRADGTDPYGKSEPLQGTRCGPDRRRVPAAQRGRRQKAPTRKKTAWAHSPKPPRPTGRTRGARSAAPGASGGTDRPRPGFQGGAAAAAAGGSPPPPAPSSNIAESRSPSGSPSSGSCAATFPSSVRPSCAASPTRPPSSDGTAFSPRYPATSTGTSTSSGSARHDGWDPAARVVRHILMADVTDATCHSLG